jgi:putative PIN family toxin of toxin-antitoxin system
VFDCNILVQALAFDGGPAAACLRLVEAGEIELLFSKATSAELRRVMAYQEVVAISPNLTPLRIAAFIQRLAFRATLVGRVPSTMDFPRDPADEPYLDLVIAAKADFLVTRDKDLLSLMAGHSDICRRFRRKTRPLRVLNPVSFLRSINKS